MDGTTVRKPFSFFFSFNGIWWVPPASLRKILRKVQPTHILEDDFFRDLFFARNYFNSAFLLFGPG